MKRKAGFFLVAILAAVVCWGVSLFIQDQAQARSVAAVEGAQYNTGLSLVDNLKTFMGKDVFIHLRSGITLQGYIKSVGDHLVHLEKLAGKDFYDALVRIEDIGAIEARFREMK